MSSSENPRPGTFFPAFFLIRRFARTIEAKIQWIVESEESRAHLFPVSYFVVESENEPRKKKIRNRATNRETVACAFLPGFVNLSSYE